MISVKKLLDLTGKSALVTGAAQGFGFAIAKRLVDAGATVVLTDRNLESVERAARILREDRDSTVFCAELDVTNELQVIELFQKYPNLDTLVNNAGVFSNHLLLNLSAQEFERILSVNLSGAFVCSREFARQATGAIRKGVIVNIASVDALNPSCEGQVHYTASKHGLAGLTKALSVELAPKGIRVNAVCPGAAITEGAMALVSAGAPDGIDIANQWAGIALHTPLGRLIEPDDVALAVLFLVSPMAAGITGVLLPVDGGILTQPLEGYSEVPT